MLFLRFSVRSGIEGICLEKDVALEKMVTTTKKEAEERERGTTWISKNNFSVSREVEEFLKLVNKEMYSFSGVGNDMQFYEVETHQQQDKLVGNAWCHFPFCPFLHIDLDSSPANMMLGSDDGKAHHSLASHVDVYKKCMAVDDAKKVFDEMPKRYLVSWIAMIGACTECRNPQDSLDYMSKAIHDELKAISLMERTPLKQSIESWRKGSSNCSPNWPDRSSAEGCGLGKDGDNN
ncbi:hypothetical protein BUALT_Bualt11G0094100 [Buddleja alternifolia]|uniref:Uncharacterized protein n=1 Tax=Buddleja alternifolia TaxID=168488 RepID=A0AAV6WUN4_9LAMI|nr:hypothetical protein BUALT_Bualt11G0094100 [Buddleja alternifolia]